MNVAAGQAQVDLAAGDDVTCTYRHSREGTISITKSAAGAAASDRFTFTGPAGLAGDYAAGETRSIASLAGVYTVTEVIPSGWRLSAISCTGGVVTYSGRGRNRHVRLRARRHHRQHPHRGRRDRRLHVHQRRRGAA